jgi:hypothetical protein
MKAPWEKGLIKREVSGAIILSIATIRIWRTRTAA